MTGDQQPADLRDLPFDQYQRYRIAGEILALLGAQGVLPPAPAILDVGGYPGLLPRFVADPRARTVVLDMVPDTRSAHHYAYTYVVGSGMHLPFPDGSFDCVVSLDTLEHVPAEARPALLAEMRRVGRAAALFIGPIHREETALSEELLFDYIQWLLKAKQEQLAEHRGFGLPDFPATEESFRGAGWATFAMPAGNLYNWLFMMVAKHYLISFHDEQASEFERRLDRFYNLTFSAQDRQEPAYRGVLVATRHPQPAALAALAAAYPPVAPDESANVQRMELTGLLLRLLDLKIANHEDRALREQLGLRDQNVAALQGRIGLFERDLAAAQGHAGNLQTVIDTQRAQLQASIDALGVQLQASQDHIGNLQTQLAESQGHIANLQQIAEELRRELEAASRVHGELARLQAEHTALVQDHEQTVAEGHRMYTAYEQKVAEVGQKNEHILYLEQLLQGIEAGRVFRATRTASRFLGRK